MSVPGADELFRRTVVAGQGTAPAGQADDGAPDQAGSPDQQAPAAPSGRIRHDEKMTVYVTADELLDLEHARLALRRAGLSVDRGRLVREAIVIALTDLEANGQDSMLVHRLTRQ